MITEEDIKSIIQDKANYGIAYEKVRDLIEPIIITTVMEITNRNQSESARLLGINRGTFGKNLKIWIIRSLLFIMFLNRSNPVFCF